MKKFLVLYRMDMVEMGRMMQTMSKEDQVKSMAEWNEWMEANASHFVEKGDPVGKNWQVTPAGTAQVSNDIGGYSIVQAESIDAAAKLMASGPHMKMPGATTDVMQIVEMSM
jgi:hypothetical protein